MALVSGGRSTLNPNTPLFVPAAMRQVEDYSPEWYNLITTSTWFRDYWLSQQHQGEEDISQHDGKDIVQMLPDSIDCGVDDDILNMEAQYEEFLQSSEGYNYYGTETSFVITENGYGKNADELMNNLGMSGPGILKSPWEATKNWGKPSNTVSPNFIQQPR